MKKIKNKKSHELRSKSALNKNNKNTNPGILKKKKKHTHTHTHTHKIKTEFSSKSLIHMIFTNQTYKPNKQTNLQQTHKPIFS